MKKDGPPPGCSDPPIILVLSVGRPRLQRLDARRQTGPRTLEAPSSNPPLEAFRLHSRGPHSPFCPHPRTGCTSCVPRCPQSIRSNPTASHPDLPGFSREEIPDVSPRFDPRRPPSPSFAVAVRIPRHGARPARSPPPCSDLTGRCRAREDLSDSTPVRSSARETTLRRRGSRDEFRCSHAAVAIHMRPCGDE